MSASFISESGVWPTQRTHGNKFLRFPGDPVGYVIDWNSTDRPHGWLWAHVGFNGRRVLVDADKAYRIDDT